MLEDNYSLLPSGVLAFGKGLQEQHINERVKRWHEISTNIASTGISNIVSNNSNIEPIASNLVATVSQQGIYDAPKTELYHEILNQVGKIPKPLSFVDDFDYKL